MWREIADIGTIYTKKRLRGYDKSQKSSFTALLSSLWLCLSFQKYKENTMRLNSCKFKNINLIILVLPPHQDSKVKLQQIGTMHKIIHSFLFFFFLLLNGFEALCFRICPILPLSGLVGKDAWPQLPHNCTFTCRNCHRSMLKDWTMEILVSQIGQSNLLLCVCVFRRK